MTVTDYAGYPADLIDVIVEGAERHALPPLLLLALALGESSLNPEAVGDGGQSFGVYQIHIPAHGGPPERWTGLAGTAAAMDLMAPRWRNAWAARGGRAAWEAQPEAFLLGWWPAAQGSIQPAAGRVYEVLRDAGAIWTAYQAAHTEPEPEPEPEPHVCPPLSPEWTLRVGLAETLAFVVRDLLLPVLPAGTALGSARTTLLAVTRTIDEAGGG